MDQVRRRLLLCLAAAMPAWADGPRELGVVRWGQDLEAALAESRSSGRPVLLLFQEIPGCATCVGFGEGPLSHPLLVEAVETEFVPVAVHNNRSGKDAEVLRRFEEPAWNNPVVRFLDARGRDLIPRADGVWREGALPRRMVQALRAADRDVPGWLALATEELAAAERRRATFAMHCYWEGEAQLGALDGVLATAAGFRDGQEVVEVVYDPARIGYPELNRRAAAVGCARRAWDEGGIRAAGEADRKYHLRRSPLRLLPLTPLQAARANGDLRSGRDPRARLSPRQRALLGRVEETLARDPKRLEGLRPPEDGAELAAYERSLRGKL